MNLARYCKLEKGMTLQEYRKLQAELDNLASQTIEKAKAIRKPGTGVYWPIEELGAPVEWEFWPWLMMKLKEKFMEFLHEDGKLWWRY